MNDMRLELQSFTRNICEGFVRYQQNGDFVDMTVAAEGHLVKVHKNILSLSSPYIEEVLKTVPCKHPVIFLNNISHVVLGYILEYVYTGVTSVPKDIFDEFKAACKHLQIIGVKDLADTSWAMKRKKPVTQKTLQKKIHSQPNIPIATNAVNENANCENDATNIEANDDENDNIYMKMDIEPNLSGGIEAELINECPNTSETPAVATSTSNEMYQIDLSHIDVNSKKNNMEQSAKFILNSVLHDSTFQSQESVADIQGNSEPFNYSTNNLVPCVNNTHFYAIQSILPDKCPLETPACDQYNMETTAQVEKISGNLKNIILQPQTDVVHENDSNAYPNNDEWLKDKGQKPLELGDSNMLFMLSVRGAVQLVLNRFMYSMHHKAYSSRKRRWRCIDYRHNKCNAYVDTDYEKITERVNAHNHGFHDKEILKKGRKGTVFTSLSTAIAESIKLSGSQIETCEKKSKNRSF